jgi:hypothetical protein
VYEISVIKPEGKKPVGRPRLDRRIILKLNLNEKRVRIWIWFIYMRYEQIPTFRRKNVTIFKAEDGDGMSLPPSKRNLPMDRPSGSIKDDEILN